MGTKPRKPAPSPEPSGTSNETELPERWSVQRKSELVLRLLRGEALDAVSRESQVPAHELESWKRIFLEQGTRGLKTRSDPEERELTLARAKIGELMMRLELAEHLILKKGAYGRVEEAAAMRGTVSAATGRRYPLTTICAIFRVSHSTVYRRLAPASSAPPVAAKRGPKTRWSDAGGRRGNPHGAGGDSVPRRRLSEGPGSPGPSGPGHRRERRLALDARASAARTPAPRT